MRQRELVIERKTIKNVPNVPNNIISKHIDIDQIFNIINSSVQIKKEKNFGVAVSGGVDSMTLLYVLNQWSKRYKKNIIIFNFDHGLRKESKKEAELVQKTCKGLNLKFVLLNWSKKPKTAILEKARIERYNSIVKQCKKNNIGNLFTAHHADDLIESFSMRILKSSKLDGLCPMQFKRKIFNIIVLRPFLKIRKQSLYAFAKKNHLEYIEDSSNQNLKYERARTRKVLKNNPDLSENFLLAIELFCKLRKYNENIIKNHFSSLFKFKREGYISLSYKAFEEFPKFLLLKFLNICLSRIGNREYPTSTKLLEKIYLLLKEKKIKKFTASGCIIFFRSDEINIIREFNAIKKNRHTLKKDERCNWDNKFIIKNLYKNKVLDVLPLGLVIDEIKDCKKFKEIKIKKIPYLIKITLPVIKGLEGLLAVPHLNIYTEKKMKDNIRLEYLEFYQ